MALMLSGCFGAGDTDTDSDDAGGTLAGWVDAPLPELAAPLPITELVDFSGVARLNMGSNCTGTLIDTGVATAPAYILTNGHCTGDVGRSGQGTTIAEEWFGEAEFFRAEGNFDATASADGEVLEYSTMYGRDLAIVRLDTTLGALQALGARAMPIADEQPKPGADVINVAVPMQNLDEDEQVLRRGNCTLAEQHTLIEFGWLWFDAWANDCPGVVQGSSGSPLFGLDAEGAPEAIVAMINTTSWGASAQNGGWCFINRPCQVSADGVNMVEQTSYAVSVAGVNRCFDASGVFTLGGECPLVVTDVWANRGGGSFRGGGEGNAMEQLPDVSLHGRVEGEVRTVLVPLGNGQACTEASTYAGSASQVLPFVEEPWADGLVVDVDLPATEGHYALCAVSGADYAGAVTVLFEVDRTPPLFRAGAEVEALGEGVFQVRPHLAPPEITTVRFTHGLQGKVDCTDTASFQEFFIVPLTLFPEELPATYCVYGMDAAGNTTPVETVQIPRK